ncbi:MAG: hypothetical protein Ct9H300mP27_06350 [Chloroflexota bacterium]|nr:MAG: hypothetical protein Ct9H300mP27_06350 [Chloroflexota bacterium]
MREFTGQTGPVMVEIPSDIALEEVPENNSVGKNFFPNLSRQVIQKMLTAAHAQITARYPVIQLEKGVSVC